MAHRTRQNSPRQLPPRHAILLPFCVRVRMLVDPSSGSSSVVARFYCLKPTIRWARFDSGRISPSAFTVTV
jgi:hypothetical protein